LQHILQETGATSLRLAIAPTTSIAGTAQIVARSLETALHKLSELKFELGEILSGSGVAPLPPPATTTVQGIGRTNDAILYGGCVTLWVDSDPAQVAEIGPRIPSSTSTDYGRPFAETFQSANFDFYKIDPHLFSPAQISFINLRDGTKQTFGSLAPEILERSFHG
jgi:methenyltetrahydromethanopterin cyclohydrolase